MRSSAIWEILSGRNPVDWSGFQWPNEWLQDWTAGKLWKKPHKCIFFPFKPIRAAEKMKSWYLIYDIWHVVVRKGLKRRMLNYESMLFAEYYVARNTSAVRYRSCIKREINPISARARIRCRCVNAEIYLSLSLSLYLCFSPVYSRYIFNRSPIYFVLLHAIADISFVFFFIPKHAGMSFNKIYMGRIEK